MVSSWCFLTLASTHLETADATKSSGIARPDPARSPTEANSPSCSSCQGTHGRLPNSHDTWSGLWYVDVLELLPNQETILFSRLSSNELEGWAFV